MTSTEPLRRAADAASRAVRTRAEASGAAPRVRLPLAWRLIGATALPVALVLGATLAWASRAADRAGEVAAQRGVLAMRTEVAAYLDGDARALQEGAAVFARAPAFRSLVATGRSADALDQAREAAEQLRAAWVQITDGAGVRLAKSDEPTAPNAPLTSSPLVRTALEGRAAASFGTLGDTALVHVVVLPIEGASEGRVVGTLMIARPLDAAAARRRVGGEEGGEVAFVVFPRPEGGEAPAAAAPLRVSAATLAVTPALRTALATLTYDSAATADDAARPRELVADATRYLALAEPLRAATGRVVGGYAVLRSRDAELAAFAELRRTILLAGGAGLVAALLVALAVARQVTRPLGRLAEVARRAATGEYDAQVAVRSGDEVGVLAAAFQALLDDLREKQVLVEFARLTPGRPAGRRWSATSADASESGERARAAVAAFETAPFARRSLAGAAAAEAGRGAAGEEEAPVAASGEPSGAAVETAAALPGDAPDGARTGAPVGAVARAGPLDAAAAAVAALPPMESATSRDVAGGPGSRTAGPPVDAPGGARAGGAARTGDTGAGESSRGGARPAGPRNLMVTALAGIRGAAEALRPGQRFADRYRVEAMIGAGATGVVFRVYDVETEERRALKVLRPDVALTDPHALARLAREARTAGALAHPNIVRTYELGESDGLHFLTMEYVEGTTLRELLDRGGPLPIDAAVTSVRQLCRALAYAHKQGVVHRDVKPHNAVVSPSGVLRVMDFGIARFAGAPSGITETGVLIGTPAYMAPEVLRGATADVRSDVYGTGAVLYECLTGRPPFGDASGVQALVVLTQVLEEAPGDPRALRPEVPEGLAQVVLAALAKDATRRPQSAEELGERLAPYA